ncbi:ArnT family glycosyltransferase [Actinomycetospora soli]|uniref:ArnT family glycosyltransferase n=1 Tax=Actinomycetospora soli TaxID=2893887 RepID=UPI001E5EEA0F|nr:hypothetical protein [Actinomycetospora soli]MCD2188197.1 hypothetical protein [Actinomycetospora soli]
MRASLGRRGPAPEWLVALVVAVVSAVPVLWNIGSAPDTMFDEVSYVMAMRNIALGGDYTWSNQPVFVHPPLSFVLQAGWQWLWGLADADLETSVRGARVFAGLATVAVVVLTVLIARRLMTAATPRRRAVLTVVIVALAATDPILLRYLRMAIIEPFAVALSLFVLLVAMRLDAHRPAVYVPLIGTSTGLALLTKEMSVFLVATPLVAAVLARDVPRVKRSLGALAVGGVVWLAFPAWAIGLGLGKEFADEKLLLFYRLLGIVQTTGWNRPGFSSRSLLEATAIAGRDYGTSYLVLLGGGLALVRLLLCVPDGGARWLLAWLLTSYGFGGYMVAFGSLNEHLFVYLVPAAVVGTVLVGDALVARARPARAVALGLVVVAVGFSLGGWVRNDAVDGDGVFRSAAHLRDTRPACDVVNGIGDSGKWAPLLPGRELTDFGTGQAAASHGVHLFFVSGKDPAVGNALPELPAWITAHGTRLASFPSATYGGLELWEVPADPFDPLADVEPTRDGVFVTTVGSRCGGYPVLGALAARWEERGGKGVLGPPRGSASGTTQVFAGAVLTDAGARPVVRELAATDPAAYAAAGLPPVTAPGGLDDGALTDPAIRAAYLRAPEGTPGAFTSAANRLGAPLGPPTTGPDGSVSQPFAAVVLTRAAGSDVVRAAPVGDLAVRAGLVALPPESTVPVAPPPLAGETAPDQPSSLRGFAGALLVLLVGVAGVPAVVVLARRRPSGAAPHRQEEQP